MERLTKEQVEDILVRSGVGKRYSSMKLRYFGEQGKAFADLVTKRSRLADALERGTNYYIQGGEARDFAMTFGGAVAIRGYDVKAIHLSALSDAYDQFTDQRELIEMCDLLIVQGFYDKSLKQPPLEPRSRFRIEWVITERVALERSVVLVGNADMTLATWWSANLLDVMTKEFETIAVDEKEVREI